VRFGKTQVTAAGLLLIAASGLLALAGLELLHFWGSLVLLGLGWNFGFVGATALLTDAYRQDNPSERARVQAFNDFLMFGVVALASFGSGSLLGSAGWNVINALMLPLIAIALALLAWGARVNRESSRSA
jgi:MFS family permease